MTAWFDNLRGLVNSLSGLGGSRDKGAFGTWYYDRLPVHQIEAAYRSNWMARKAVDIPAFDMFRAGWEWTAKDSDVDAIRGEERRLGVQGKLHRVTVLARLYGGAALVLSDGAEETEAPLDITRIAKGGLRYIAVLDRYQVVPSVDVQTEIGPGFGLPEFYDITAGNRTILRVHNSRVIPFVGAERPDRQRLIDEVWGDSVLDAIEIAIRDATAGQAGIAALIQEAKLDVVKIKDLSVNVATQVYQDRLRARFDLAGRMKSTVNTLILDAEEEHDQKTINFSSLDDIQRLLLQIVSGAADIPATRFLGQSPAGMSATGESDMRNYYDRISAEQGLMLRPCIEPLVQALLQSALGGHPDDVEMHFLPLWQMTEKENAEINKSTADATKVYIETGAVPMPVIEAGVRQHIIDHYPGASRAYDEWDEANANPGAVDPSATDPDDMDGPEGA